MKQEVYCGIQNFIKCNGPNQDCGICPVAKKTLVERAKGNTNLIFQRKVRMGQTGQGEIVLEMKDSSSREILNSVSNGELDKP